jgi:hypothetical protein
MRMTISVFCGEGDSMYATRLIIDADEINAPPWDMAESAICTLDNARKTLVMLQADEDHWIGCGGGGMGAEAKYLVTVTDGASYYHAITPSSDAAAAPVRLVVGGQAVDYPSRSCVELATALRAFRVYTQTGVLDPDTRWEES